jgi:hypothetical protein
LATEVWQIAAVVDVRMAEDDGIELLRIEREIAITLEGFVTFALKESAFEQEPLLIDFEEEHRSSRRAGGAEEVDLHGARMTGKDQGSKFKVWCRICFGFRILRCHSL